MSIVISLNRKQHEWLKQHLGSLIVPEHPTEMGEIYTKISKTGTKIAPTVADVNQAEQV